MVLALDSPRWKTLDGNGELAARLLQYGAAADFAELDHQACHQFTVSGTGIEKGAGAVRGAVPVDRCSSSSTSLVSFRGMSPSKGERTPIGLLPCFLPLFSIRTERR
jgi:hypothetical protein